jgi:hypothetical protein
MAKARVAAKALRIQRGSTICCGSRRWSGTVDFGGRGRAAERGCGFRGEGVAMRRRYHHKHLTLGNEMGNEESA